MYTWGMKLHEQITCWFSDGKIKEYTFLRLQDEVFSFAIETVSSFFTLCFLLVIQKNILFGSIFEI